MHPLFATSSARARAAGRHVMDRCNLTITRLPNYADLPEFLAEHRVEVVASLPSFAARQTDAQRGEGVFADLNRRAAAIQRARLRRRRIGTAAASGDQPGRRVPSRHRRRRSKWTGSASCIGATA